MEGRKTSKYTDWGTGGIEPADNITGRREIPGTLEKS